MSSPLRTQVTRLTALFGRSAPLMAAFALLFVLLTPQSAQAAGGSIVSVTVVNGGSGYSVGNILSLQDATGGGTATVQVTSVSGPGAVTALTLTNQGSNYSGPGPFSATGGAGTGASIGATMQFTVTQTGDPGDGTCNLSGTGDGCTLREAITSANSTTGDDIIIFASGVSGIIQLTGALPNLSSNLTINGPGARLLSVRRNAGGDYRIFTVAGGVTVNISGLTVTNGRTANGVNSCIGSNGGDGGGIHNFGTLTLSGVAVSGNQTGNGGNGNGGNGGSGGNGGGIFNLGMLTLLNSTVSGNQTGNGGSDSSSGIGGSGGSGGGISNMNGTLYVTDSTISGNQTGSGGSGGGIINTGTTTLTNSTITDNHTGGVGGNGGGISALGTVNVRNTIIAGNTAPDDRPGPDFFNAATSQGFNLIGNTTDSSGFTQPTDQTNVDPQLGPLADNGGQTDTHALAPISLAIDKGDDGSASPTTDQRGLPRPVDFASISNASGGDGSDIGAFELQNSAPVAVSPTPDPTTNEDTSVIITLTATDSEDEPLSFTITDHPDHGTITPLSSEDCSAVNTCTRQYTYTPTANYYGPDSFQFNVVDSFGSSPNATVNITINAVNDAPSFTMGADQTVFNSAPQTIPNWATSISAGPANEATQVLDFIVTNNNNALFAAQPAIDPSGTLTFTPALGISGTATVSVQIHDNGGTALSGQDTSAVQTFLITVNLTGWTISGAHAATEDESNPAKPTYTNFAAAANPGSPAGTYVLRYNITAIGNLIAPGAVSTRLRVRFRDEGAGSQVIVAIMRASIFGGAAPLGTVFDSNAYTADTGFQTQEILMPALAFDFTQNTYWLEVRLIKAETVNLPGFGSAQINQQ